MLLFNGATYFLDNVCNYKAPKLTVDIYRKI